MSSDAYRCDGCGEMAEPSAVNGHACDPAAVKRFRTSQYHNIVAKQADFAYSESVIHLFVGGSEAHGAKVGNYDDLDLYGVFIPAPNKALGIAEYEYDEEAEQKSVLETEHFVWSTAGNERKNTKDDIDLALYSLRKWAGMAAKGNPTALHFLFVPNLACKASCWEKNIRANSELFVSSHAGFHFSKFAEQQLRRLHGIGTGKKGQRHDLIEKFGYDTKAGMHVIRILFEGIELMETGKLTLPRPEKELLINIRTGSYGSLSMVDKLANDLFVKLEDARKNSKLPEDVDRPAVSNLVAKTYLEFWTHNAPEFQQIAGTVM